MSGEIVDRNMKDQFWRDPGTRRYLLLLIPIAISMFMVYQIARRGGFNVHPDEYAHIDAICYYETHWWMPNVNSDGIIYSGYGWNRLYDGEFVYLLYGKLALLNRAVDRLSSIEVSDPPALLRAVENLFFSARVLGSTVCENQIEIYSNYRMFNVWLYLITLMILFGLGLKHPWPLSIALLLLCVPQVSYIYSYVNSDAWGLSMSLLLFVFVLVRREKLLGSWPYLIVLAILTSLVILSKKTFWLSIPYAYLLLGLGLVEDLRIHKSVSVIRYLIRLCLLFALTLLCVAPFKIVYPLSQGNFEERAQEMREERASPGFKPSHPTHIGYRLAERGYSIWSVANMDWLKLSAASFYGLFGYMSERLPQWLYTIAYGLMFILAATTFVNLALLWKEIHFTERFMILFAPISILLVVLASLYNSWVFDFQPQGRYLFAALIPLALLQGGLVCHEPRSVKIFRLFSWLILYLLCLGVLWFSVLGNPKLVPG